MMTPPATWDSTVFRLTIRPQSCTATTFVTRTTPVSLSTCTSATWQPQTPTLETFLLSSLVESAYDHLPSPLAWSMPSRAQACFHSQLLPLDLSTTLPT